MVGVPVSTLRTWEERYGLVIAVRSSGGQRRYTREQLAQLSFVVEQLGQGFSPGDAHRLLAEHIAQGTDPRSAGTAEEQTGILILIAERDRLQSGSGRLDGILGGGLPGNAIHLIVGPPGSGKTILAEQYAFANATVERPAVYLSTVSEPLDKLIRFGQTLEFFDVSSVGQRIFYESLGEDLEEGGLQRTLERMRVLLRERHPGILIIDSFKALAAYAPTRRDYRSFLFELAADASAVAGSSFWLGEYDLETISGEPEAAVADSILGLGFRSSGER